MTANEYSSTTLSLPSNTTRSRTDVIIIEVAMQNSKNTIWREGYNIEYFEVITYVM